MKKKKLHITINTRILLYFLFVTILPLAILALSSTFLLHYSLSEKSEQELAKEIESLQSVYNSVFNRYKNLVNSDAYATIPELIEKNDIKNLKKSLYNLKDFNQLSFAVLFNDKFDVLEKIHTSEKLTLYPIKDYKSDLNKMFSVVNKTGILLTSEILDFDQLASFGFTNKIILKKQETSQKNFGILTQIAIIPIYNNSKEDNNSESGEKQLDNTKPNIDTPLIETIPDDPDFINDTNNQLNTSPIGYLLVGNFINSGDDLSVILKDLPGLPVNITQFNYVVALNPNVTFDVSSLASQNPDKKLSLKDYNGEHFLNNKWFRLKAKNITNYDGDKIGMMIVGFEEGIFRSVKAKNNLLILQVAIIIASGGLALAFLFAKNIIDPIYKMRDAVKSIESGNLNYTLEIPTEDELGELATSINEMARALQARKEEITSYNKMLLDQKTKLETIFNYSADGIMTLDKDKKIVSINPAIERWLGNDAKNVQGKYYYEVIKFSPDYTKFTAIEEKIEDFEDLTQISKYFPNAQINNIELEISYSPMDHDEDSVISYVLILRDITKRKETEELRENFIATLTHDLRTPLLACVQTLEFMLKGSYGELTSNQQFITRQLIHSNTGLLRMVNTLLDTYSYESGKHTLVKREINLNKLLIDSINELKALSDDKKHNVIFEDTNTPYKVIADKQEIKRVITNLLSNAIIHTPENGTITFNIDTQDSLAVVSIKDTGVGLSEKDKERIFNRYSRGGRTLRKIGTGLGLYLSKHIVEAHGGTIWVQSKLKEGSTFFFTLPLSIKGLDEDQDE